MPYDNTCIEDYLQAGSRQGEGGVGGSVTRWHSVAECSGIAR